LESCFFLNACPAESQESDQQTPNGDHLHPLINYTCFHSSMKMKAVIKTSSTPSSSSILLGSAGGRLSSQAQPRLSEGPWEPAGTHGWDKASSRSTAPGSAPRFCSVTDGDRHIVPPRAIYSRF